MRDIPHVHTQLDASGYCLTCDKRIITSFKGFPLPDRPCQKCTVETSERGAFKDSKPCRHR